MQHTGIGVCFNENVIGHRAAGGGQTRHQRGGVGFRGGVHGVALGGPLGQRTDFEHDHDDRDHQQRCRGQGAVAAGVGDLGVTGVIHAEVQPTGEQTRQNRQHQEDGQDREAGDHRLFVEPRHPVVADVEPAVDTRCRPGQYEQQRGHIQRDVAPAVQSDPGEREGGDCAQRTCEGSEHTELHGPFRRREGEQQKPDGGRADQPPDRSPRHPGYCAAAQQDCQHAEQAQQQHQHREATRHRRVDAVLDGEEVVAQEVLIPGDGRADNIFDASRLGDRGQRLVTEHDHEDQRRRREQGGQRSDQTVDGSAAADDPCHGAGTDEQWCHRDQPLRRQRHRECGHHDGNRVGQQAPGGDRVFDERPPGDHAERDQRLRA